MLFSCAAAAVAAAASHSPAWFLSGAYHPPLPGKSGESSHHMIGNDVRDPGTEISGEALTVALDVVQAWAVLLTVGFTLIIFFFLAFCVCSKKDDGYDEYEISQGITTVKICHDGGENGVSLIPRLNGSGTDSMKATDETSEASSRYTLKRELPAIPTSTSGNVPVGAGQTERPMSQHSLDLYASVNDPAQAGSSSVKLIGGVQVLPAGAIAPGGRAAVVKETVSPPGGDLPDAKVKKDATRVEEHFQGKMSQPFAKKAEHPYAKVGARKGPQEGRVEAAGFDEPKSISKDLRNVEPEGRHVTSPKTESHTEEKQAVVSPQGRAGDHSIKTDMVGGGHFTSSHSPHLSTASSQSMGGRSPTSPQYRSPTFPQSEQSPQPAAPIPAAMAISGRTPANEEMPYMTPSVLQQSREQSQQQQQQHFSGDSQDSRGYTSISVREPLAALKARQAAEGAIAALGRTSAAKSAQMHGAEGEGYYMTVSDDSADEMYACIYEGGSRGTGSETYAQIEPRTTPSGPTPPSVLSASNLPPASPTGPSRTPQDPSPPAPPSVDSLRHVVHSRQASAGSSVSTGMGSPVAEKRGTRSPLPPLPQGDTVLYSPPDPPILSSQPVPKSPPKAISHIIDKQTPRNLDEMYAKVLKKPAGHSRGSSSGTIEGDATGGTSSPRRGSAEFGGGRWPATSSAPTRQPQDMTHSLVETRAGHDSVLGVNRAKSCDVSSSWGGLSEADRKGKISQSVDNYETIPSQYAGSDPGYETVKNGEPPYASVDTGNYPGYETVRGSDVESEPGYETLKHKEFEPGYETVSEVASKKSLGSEPGYESLTTTEYEPGYETVSSKKSMDPGYESVGMKMEYDPGYEELAHPTRATAPSESDPNYEQLKFTSRRSSKGDNGYEVLDKGNQEGNYEMVSDYDTQMAAKTDVFEEGKSSGMPLYASVKKKGSPKKEQVDPPTDVPAPEKTEDLNLLVDIPTGFDSVPAGFGKSEPIQLLDDFFRGTADAQDVTKLKNEGELSNIGTVTDLLIDTEEQKESDAKKFPVLDSPEDVELPLPGEEDQHGASPPTLAQELSLLNEDAQSGDQGRDTITVSGEMKTSQSGVSLTFTAASPAQGSPETSKSSESSGGSTKEAESKKSGSDCQKGCSSATSCQTECSPATDCRTECSPAVPAQFKDSETKPSQESGELLNSIDDPLPPPPIPVLDDEGVMASPPPPPPPIPDEVCHVQDLPPPPVGSSDPSPRKDSPESGNINGLSPTSPGNQSASEPAMAGSCASAPFELPPPPVQCEDGKPEAELSDSAAKSGCINGSMTVTVNPMADLMGEGESPLIPPPPSVAPAPAEAFVPPAHPPPSVGGESGESHSSGSTVNGSGSVESVVTVDPKSGGDPSTTVPPTTLSGPPLLQHSSSTSSSDSKHSDPNEGITPV